MGSDRRLFLSKDLISPWSICPAFSRGCCPNKDKDLRGDIHANHSNLTCRHVPRGTERLLLSPAIPGPPLWLRRLLPGSVLPGAGAALCLLPGSSRLRQRGTSRLCRPPAGTITTFVDFVFFVVFKRNHKGHKEHKVGTAHQAAFRLIDPSMFRVLRTEYDFLP